MKKLWNRVPKAAKLALDLLTDGELLQKAKEEFAERAESGYVCPIEPNAVPIAL